MSRKSQEAKERRQALENKISKTKEIRDNHIKGVAEANRLIHVYQMELLCKEGTPTSVTMVPSTIHGIPQFRVTNNDGKEFLYDMEDVPHELRYAVLERNKHMLGDKIMDKAIKNGWLSNSKED